ncbi:metal ABC transporter permease [Luteimonas sp. XNQY3]|nr:metal ABC transporter permease [Luteimonas sp. XNQY3]MCD9004797.1 metal ABC transporter permease [Luteimonas sp. XNQY3]
MIDLLLEPLRLDFMRDALLVASLVSLPTALLSCFLVLRGWALMGDAIAHAVLPGVVLSYLIGLPYVVGAFAAGMGCALAIGYLKEHSRVRHDTLMGVVFSGMFALGLVLYVAIHSDVHLDHILFGDMLGIVPADLWLAGGIVLLAVLVVGWRWRDLLLHAFDPVHAASIGLPVRALHYGLLALLSLAIVGTLKSVGLVLAIALLIAPGAIAFLLVRTFPAMLLTAAAVSLFASLAGVYLSFLIDSAPAPTIVVLLGMMFVLTFLLHQTRGSARTPTAPQV